METIALNAHVETPPCSLALEWMNQPLSEDLFEQRSQIVRDLVNAEEGDSLIFTSSGAEAINQVLWSVFFEVVRKEGKTHLITSCLEDAPTLQMMKRLEELGCVVKIVSANEKGKIDLEELKQMISPRTALISLGMAQGLTGVIQPIDKIIHLARENNVLLHLDASYALGKTFFSFDSDYLTFSGDPIHSVSGSGALLAKANRPLVPFVLGIKNPPPASMALCAAAHQTSLFLDTMSLEVARLRDQFEQELMQRTFARSVFPDSLRLPNTTCLLFPRVHQGALFYFLKQKGIVSSIGGNYCQHLHRLLMASQYEEEIAQTAVSFSLSRMTSEQEILCAVERITEVVQNLQKISEDL